MYFTSEIVLIARFGIKNTFAIIFCSNLVHIDGIIQNLRTRRQNEPGDGM